MEFNFFTAQSSLFISCPKCGASGKLSRMKIDSESKKIIFRVFQLRQYHCNDCKHDSVFFNYRLKKNASKILLNNLILIAVLILLGIISYYITKRYF